MPTWDELYARGFTFTEPLPWVKHVTDAFQTAKAETVLDVGCGTGRHLVWLEHLGFSVWGTDISPNGLRESRLRLEREHLPARVVLADMRAVPFGPAVFDAALSIHVLYHTTRPGMRTALAEIGRSLRPAGLFAATFLSTRTWKYGEGLLLERDTYVQERGGEAGVPHHYCDEEDLRSLLAEFDLLEMHLDEFLDAAGERQSHWEILARRPSIH